MSNWSKTYLQICHRKTVVERAITELKLYLDACKRSGERVEELESHLNTLELELVDLDSQTHAMLNAPRA